MIEAEQVFPYPEVLDADQKETLQMLVGSNRIFVYKTSVLQFLGGVKIQLKGTVIVFSSDPPCKDDNAQFTTVPLKPCPSKYELDINVFVSLNCSFHLRFLCESDLIISCL